MKIYYTLFAMFIGTLSISPAGEANPFVVRNLAGRPSMEPAGESIMSLTENLLVPAGKLDLWLENNPVSEDASALRAAVQEWLRDGSARFDQTAISNGVVGRIYQTESIREQIYATEYMPGQDDEWPIPTAFATRNLGYVINGGANVEQGAMILRARFEYCGMMLPHHAWSELSERTRHSGDIFIPRFRSISVERVRRDDEGQPVSEDPFAASTSAQEKEGARDLRFSPGKIYLVSRSEESLSPPPIYGNAQVVEEVASAAPPAGQKDPSRMIRLIFFRGALCTPATPANSGNIGHLSLRLARVPHSVISDWLQNTEASKTPELAWPATDALLRAGDANIIADLASPVHPGSETKMDQTEEVIYPTEFIPAKRSETDSDTTPRGPSVAASFETRKVGISMNAETLEETNGTILKLSIKQLREASKTVHHRILRDGEWKVDMTFPVFVGNHWNSELRVQRGQWILVGSGSDIDGKGNLDPANVVLAFVKAE